MSVDVQEAPVEQEVQESEISHLWCCDEDVAMCSTDISGGVPVAASGTEDPRDCTMCLHEWGTGWTCPACRCNNVYICRQHLRERYNA